jgi:hypothetical protein
VTETLRVWDTERKEAVTLPVEVARAGVLAGRFVGVKGTNYAMQDGGVLKYVKPEHLRSALAEWKPAERAVHEEVVAAARRPEGGVAATLDAARVGGARGLMGAAGLSFDRVVRDVAGGVEDFRGTHSPYAAPVVTSTAERAMGLLERQREDHSFATGAGEMGGMVMAAALTGGGAAGLGTRAASAAGLGKLGAAVAGTAAEGAIMANAELDGELARMGEEYTGQAFLAHGGVAKLLAGAAMGGVAGAAGHGLEAGIGAARRSLARGAGDFAQGVAATGRDLGLGNFGKRALPAGVDAAEHAAAEAAAEAGGLVRRVAGESLEDMAEGRGVRSTQMALEGKALFERQQIRIANEATEAAQRVMNDSIEILAETHGAKGAAQYRNMVTPGLTPQVEAAARQALEDTAVVPRRALEVAREAEYAVQKAQAQYRALEAAEKAGEKSITAAERAAAADVAAVTKARDVAARRLAAAEEAMGRIMVPERKPSNAAWTKAFDDLEKAKSALRRTEASFSTVAAASEARVQAAREAATGFSAQERASILQAGEDAQQRLDREYHPLKQEYSRYLDALDDIKKSPPKTNAEWFEKLNEMEAWQRRLVDEAQKPGLSKASTDPLLKASAKAHADAAEAIGAQLKDSALYGKAGEFRKSMSQARTAQIAFERNAMPYFAKPQEMAGGGKRMIFSPDAMRTQFGVEKSLHDAVGELEGLPRGELKKWLKSTNEALELAERDLTLTAEQRAKSVETRRQIALVETAFADSAENARNIRDGEASGVWSTKRLGGMGALIGGTLLGAPGVVLGGGAALAFDRGQRIAHKSMLVRITKQVDDRFGTAMLEFWRGRPVGGGAAKTASGAFLAGKGGMGATFERSAKAIRDAMADPAGLNRMVTRSLGGLGETVPGVTMQIAQTLMRGVAYLNGHLPEGMEPDLDMVSPYDEPPVYSQSEMLSWSRRAAAVDDPLSILTHMRDGTVSEEEVDAVRTVYPDLWARIETELAKGAAQQKLDRTQRLALSTVFGIPADRNMKPEILTVLQMEPAGRAGGRGGAVAKNRGPMKMPALRSSSYKTESQKER